MLIPDSGLVRTLPSPSIADRFTVSLTILTVLFLLGLEVLDQPLGLALHRQQVGVFVDALGEGLCEILDLIVQRVHVQIVGADAVVTIAELTLLVQQFIDLLTLGLEFLLSILHFFVNQLFGALECLDLFLDPRFEAVEALGSRDIHLGVGIDADASFRDAVDSGEGTVFLHAVALDGDIGCLGDETGDVADDVLVAIDAGILGYLFNDGCTHVNFSQAAGTLQADVVAFDDHTRLCIGVQHASQVDVTDDNLGGGEDDALIIADHCARRLVEVIDLEVINLVLQLADGFQNAFLEVARGQFVEFLIPFLIY